MSIPETLFHAIESEETILFTGAGFSTGARALDGRPLPSSEELVDEIWRLVYGDEIRDESTLPDLFDVALLRCPAALSEFARRRLRVGSDALPTFYRTWLGAPWRAIYTLNVDDVEVAAAWQFGLELPSVFHLNGRVGDPIESLVFSTRQYGARLAARHKLYEQLVSDLTRSPFVFVGTSLDEAPLWQHLAEKRTATSTTLPGSFLVARSATRARQTLLEHFRIEWIRASAEEVAAEIDRRRGA
jgi:hypothetical protein